jgi:hypothetical protein
MAGVESSEMEAVLSEADSAYEYGRSEVYDPETKRLLDRVLGVMCEFVSVLGGVLTVLHSGDLGIESKFGINTGIRDVTCESHTQITRVNQRIAECKAALVRWSTNAKGALGAVVNSHTTHESVGLFFGLVFCYHQ